MAWRNAVQLEQTHRDPGFRERFSDLYALREFLGTSIVPHGYTPPATLGSSVVLTPAGGRQADRIVDEIPGISPEEARLAVFVLFAHHDLLVDMAATDPQPIRATLHDEIKGGRITLSLGLRSPAL